MTKGAIDAVGAGRNAPAMIPGQVSRLSKGQKQPHKMYSSLRAAEHRNELGNSFAIVLASQAQRARLGERM